MSSKKKPAGDEKKSEKSSLASPRNNQKEVPPPPPSSQELKTAAAKRAFLAALMDEKVFTVLEASRITGIEPSTHYRWVKADEEYNRMTNEVMELITQRLEQRASERAYGINVKAPSDLLMMFLLNGRRPDVYRPKTKVELSGGVTVKELLLSPEDPK